MSVSRRIRRRAGLASRAQLARIMRPTTSREHSCTIRGYDDPRMAVPTSVPVSLFFLAAATAGVLTLPVSEGGAR